MPAKNSVPSTRMCSGHWIILSSGDLSKLNNQIALKETCWLCCGLRAEKNGVKTGIVSATEFKAISAASRRQATRRVVSAYALARSVGDPPPEWVLGWFDEVLDGVAGERKEAARVRKTLARTLAFLSKSSLISGIATWWFVPTYFMSRRWVKTGYAVIRAAERRAKAGLPINETAAIAEAVGVAGAAASLRTARRDWKIFKKAKPVSQNRLENWPF